MENVIYNILTYEIVSQTIQGIHIKYGHEK